MMIGDFVSRAAGSPRPQRRARVDGQRVGERGRKRIRLDADQRSTATGRRNCSTFPAALAFGSP